MNGAETGVDRPGNGTAKLRTFRMRHWGAVGVATAFALLVLLQLRPPTIDLPLTPDMMRPEIGTAYIVPIEAKASFPYRFLSDMDGPEGSNLRLLEDGRVMPSTGGAHDVIRQQGGGRYSHWANFLLFSTPDGSDPRTNGRAYRVIGSAAPAKSVIWLSLLAGTATLLLFARYLPGLVGMMWLRGKPEQASAAWTGSPRVSIATKIIPLVLAAIPSLLLFAILSPLYTDMTIATAVTTPVHMMPHYPPLYAYFLWGVHEVANGICGQPSGLSDCGLYLMAVIQHAVLIAAIYYFSVSCSETLSGRIWAILPFYVMPAFLLVNHGLQTEAIWFSCLIFMLAATVGIVRRGRISHGASIVLMAAFLTAMLIRPTTVFLVPVIPASLLLILLFERHRVAFANLSMVLVLLGVATAWSIVVVQQVFMANGISPRSTWGRGTIEAIQRLVWPLEAGTNRATPRDRKEFIAPLQAAAADPLLRNAIPAIVTHLDANYAGTGKSENWGGAHYALTRTGTRDAAGNPVSVDLGLADRLVNQFCLLFIQTYPMLVYEHAINNLKLYWRDMSGNPAAAGLLTTMNDAHRGSLRFARDTAGDSPAGLAKTVIKQNNARIFADYDRLQNSSYIRLVTSISDLHLLIAIVLLALAGLLVGNLDRSIAMFVVAGLATIVVYLVLVSVLLAYLPRYELPSELLLAIMCGLLFTTVLRFPRRAMPADSFPDRRAGQGNS
jgi:hypothetical protein